MRAGIGFHFQIIVLLQGGSGMFGVVKGFSKGLLAAAAVMIGLLASGGADAASWTPPESLPSDVVIGSRDAPVTVFEYASITCPHCARFHSEMLPAFKKGWIDTGKAKIVYRHFPLDKSALAASLAVSCIPAEARPAAVSKLFETVSAWASHEDIGGAVIRSLPDAGDQSKLIACMSSQETVNSIVNPQIEAAKGGVSGTPYFFVNGKPLQGTAGADKLGELVDAAIGSEFTR